MRRRQVASEDWSDAGLVINEVAAKGDPLDWFELYNASDSHLALANFTLADDLTDPKQAGGIPGGTGDGARRAPAS